MDKMIAVEENLSPVSNYLTEKGFKVDNIDINEGYEENIDKYDALVVTGMDKDFLGAQDTITKIPVIDAKGLTEEEVYDRLSTTLKQ